MSPTCKQIRQDFIDFFVKTHGHTFVPSSPVVPLDDPTLLFTNAGMNQFKPIFLGLEKRDYVRVANTQKCIRAGGKHNDLDDVGRSRRHHTFFEMLGNWSFGNYFKRGAIEMAWELLTKVWKIDPTRLHVTCYEGDEKNGIPRDTEAANLWKEVAGVPDDHIHYFGKDNFWEMGETGPCGPCTEIYVDRTPDKTGGPQVNGTDPRVMEIWNLVFIQYNRDASGKLTTLPAQHVDTGMGLERICQVLQGKDDNYATDLFTPLFDALTKLTGIKYTGLFPKTNEADPVAEAANPQLRYDIAFRVIADHVRTLTFALTDGATPSNEGRGYVLRRILRRAVKFGRQQLNQTKPFLSTLVQIVVATMGEMFPELKKNPQRVIDMILDEEISFSRTLDRGIELFEGFAKAVELVASRNFHTEQPPLTDDDRWIHPREVAIYQAAGLGVLPAGAAFRLHDTYGFPIDLTRIMAAERGLKVDILGYEKLMKEAQEKARAGGKEEGSKIADVSPDALAKLESSGITTDDSPKFKRESIDATIKAIWNGSQLVDETAAQFNEEVAIVLDRTNFYAEMGGQVGDQGDLRIGKDARFEVRDTKIVGKYILHIGIAMHGTLKVGDKVSATVLADTRGPTEQNHTSTHLANWALREVLGDAVQQKGSLVDAEKLRFDFIHGKSMTDDELAKVESLVADCISRELPVHTDVVPQEKALKIAGLRAMFGEKYPPMVRVVSIGAPVSDLINDPGNANWRKYSVEFCGGTHLGNTKQAEAFLITAEESVSKGVRRIVALTGESARQTADRNRELESQIEKARKTADADLPAAIPALQKSIASATVSLRTKRHAQGAIAELQTRYKAYEKTATKGQATGGAQIDVAAVASQMVDSAPTLGPGKLLVGEIAGASDDQLRSAMDSLKKRAASHAIMLAAGSDGKVTFVAAVSDDLIAKGLKAGDWIRETAKVAGGGGGGRPQMAQAGGKDPAKIPDALEMARTVAKKAVGG